MRLPKVRKVIPDAKIHGRYLEAQWGEYHLKENIITVVDGAPFLQTLIHELLHWFVYLLPPPFWILHVIIHM